MDGAPDAPGRWFLVHVHAGREFTASEELRRQGYRPFVPALRRTIRHARKLRIERGAYFPGYLFVPLDLDHDRWRPINGTRGVVRIVTAEERPLAVPRGIVESLLAATGPDGLLDFAGWLKVGDEVRLTQGPFADQLGRIEQLGASERVRVLLALMQRSVTVEVHRRDLAPA